MTHVFKRDLRDEALNANLGNSIANLVGGLIGLAIVGVIETSVPKKDAPLVRPEHPDVAEIKVLRREIEDARDLAKRVDIRDHWIRSTMRSVNHLLDRAERSLDLVRPDSVMYTMRRDIVLEYLREAQRELRNIESGN